MMVDTSELEDEIARLRDLDLPTLRARWRSVFRRKAPAPLPRHLLFRILAYRLQAERLGDLDKETVRLLDRIASGYQCPMHAILWRGCLGNPGPSAARISSSDARSMSSILPAAAKSGIVSKSHTRPEGRRM